MKYLLNLMMLSIFIAVLSTAAMAAQGGFNSAASDLTAEPEKEKDGEKKKDGEEEPDCE